jgi:hypothetical protein
MSVIPEIIFHKVLVNGFRAIRKDPRILDSLFKNMSQRQLAEMKEFITKNSIDFTINYPRQDTLKVPAIAMVLRNENEAQTFLGDQMGTFPHYGMPDQDMTVDTLGGHSASVSTLSGLPTKVLGPLQVSTATTNSISFTGDAYDQIVDLLTDPLPECMKLYVVDGAGEGQVYTIISINSNSLDIMGTFDPQLDDSSFVDIRLADETGLAYGEPSRIYNAGSRNLERIGSNYETQYQLSVLAGHQDEVIYLYSVLKALLLSQRKFLEDQGIMALQMSGSDFAPRSEFLPNEVFQRVMILRFTYPFSFIQELDGVGSSIQLNIAVRDAFTGETGGVIASVVTV